MSKIESNVAWEGGGGGFADEYLFLRLQYDAPGHDLHIYTGKLDIRQTRKHLGSSFVCVYDSRYLFHSIQ